jgi:hypothetical protein
MEFLNRNPVASPADVVWPTFPPFLPIHVALFAYVQCRMFVEREDKSSLLKNV